jgi:cytochrome c-type biogenesis protein CcmH
MTFWIVALALAAAAAALIVLALLRGGDAPAAAEADLRIYRDQLAEVDRDLARGVIPAAEAERLRIEIGRRLLEADRARDQAAATAAPRGLTLAVAAAAALTVVAGSAALYRAIGAPSRPDLPLAARLAASDALRAERMDQAAAEAAFGTGPWIPPPEADAAYLDLVARLRAAVADRPGDTEGLALLARTEAGLGNYAAAHAAQVALIAAKGAAATADDYADLAGMMILAAGGYVSRDADAALQAALARDPRQPWARYYAGLLYAQTDRPDLAFRFWQGLLAESLPEAPWVPAIRAQIEDIAWRAGKYDFELPPLAAPGGSASGPTAADLEAAAGMEPEARMQMIRGMVEGLAARLAAEGGPAEDWARLIRSYAVLGEAGRVAPVLAEARAAFADDPEGLALIEAAAAEAGLPPPEAAPSAP